MTQTIEQLQARVALISQERNGYMEAADRACDERDEFKAKVAKLEAENATLHEQVDLQVPKLAFEQLQEQLAAAQADNKRLRDALGYVLGCWERDCVPEDYWRERQGFRELLDTPSSTEALDAYVSEKVKEAMK